MQHYHCGPDADAIANSLGKKPFAVAHEACFSMKYLDEFAAMTRRRLAPQDVWVKVKTRYI
jgi:hypothetical protein